METSSAVWWSSIHRSPVERTHAETPEAWRRLSKAASSVASPVSETPAPRPSSATRTSTAVSFVERARAAWRWGASSRAASAAAAARSAAGPAPSRSSIARRRPRANALKVASTTWCALSPRILASSHRTPAAAHSSWKKGSVSAVR